ncbi:MAG TPA: sigma-54 dependent transcriptional regulator, partial [bacterium]|nr:sigma-54 dependent transcriptional regulator [bacterium]
MFRILVIDDNQSICEILAETLNDKGHKVDTTLSSVAALELLKQNNYDIVITDLKMDNVSGIDILKFIRENNLDIEVIIITAFGTIETAIEAIRLGAADFILKPFEIQDIEKKIDNIINHLKLKLDNQYLTDELREIYGHKIIGKSKAILKVLDDIKKVAAVNSNVLILGETGTGKELIARAIHYSSARKNNAFVKVNCAALPFELLESELFGHEKGAFTSAYNRRLGRFEIADKGTLFIDEVSEIPLPVQVKLLRVLQEREFERLGSSETIKTDER